MYKTAVPHKLVIWDLDGTILDSFGIFEDGIRTVLPTYGIAQPSHENFMANFHGSLEDSVAATLNITHDRVLVDQIVADFLTVQDSLYKMIESHIFPDVLSIAEHFKVAGARQVLVTNRGHEGRLRASPRHIVENSSLRTYIDTVICADDSDHRKPDPRVLGDRLGDITNYRIIVVGDQFVDAEFALNLGAQACIVNRDGEHPPHLERLPTGWEKTVHVVHSLNDVPAKAAEHFKV